MKLQVRFSANHLPFSWVIRARTWSKYSHIDFVLPNGKFMGAVPLGGVCIHEHRYPTEDYFEVDVTEEEATTILNFAYDQLGKPYDFMGIFGFATNRDWQEDDKWFCSEYVAGAIQKVVPLFNEETYKVSPRDLSINVLFKKVEKPK